MRIARLAAVAAVAISALVVSACTVQPAVVEGSSISVARSTEFYSYNASTTYGRSEGNSDVIYATNSGFNYYDSNLNLVRDDSFGSYEKVSDDPLTIKYTVADGVTWSDGAAVDAADLLLAWAATSGAQNSKDFDPDDYRDSDTGEFTDDYPKDVVYFDSGIDPDDPRGPGLVTQVPIVSEDRKSITLIYNEPWVDWEVSFYTQIAPGLPAHVVAGQALGIDDDNEAKDAVLNAIQLHDEATLAPLSHFWNTGFNFTDMPDPELLVSSGPYTVTDLVAGQYVTLTANPNYHGSRQAQFETIIVRFIDDPLAAVQAMQAGLVQVITPQATNEVFDALTNLDVTIVSGYEATFEHLELQFGESKSGVFEDPLVREAFLKTVPRQEILNKLVVPLQEDAVTRDSQIFIPGAPGYADAVAANGSADYADVDIEGAVALLAEAGVANPEVCVLFSSLNPRRVNEFSLIQESAAKAGFAVTDCSDPDWMNLLGTAGAYDAVLFGWQSSSLGVTANTAAFRTGAVTNYNGYSNAEVDGLLEDLDRTFDPAAQAQILEKVDRILWDDYFGVPLFQFPTITAYDQTVVQNIAPSVLAPTVFWNIWEWSPAR